jgi:hypothetical protein
MNTDSTETTQEANFFPIERKVNLKPETLQLIRDADKIIASYGSIKLENREQYETAADQLQKIKGLAQEIEKHRVADKSPFDEAAKQVQSFYKPKLDQLASTETLLKNAITAYANEQARLAREAQAKAEEEARKEREKLQAKAEKLADKGKVEQAQAVAENAASIVAAPVHVEQATKISGLSTATTYSAECTDIIELCKAIVEGKVPSIAVEANSKFLNQQAKSLKDHFNIPGCKLVTNSTVRATAKSAF